MGLKLYLQHNIEFHSIPTLEQFQQWADAACQKNKTRELCIRIINKKESASLNQQYRQKSGPTNVLSFAYEALPGIKTKILGDLAICAELVTEEAYSQQKLVLAHWAHLTIHGILHLQGYDHVKETDALIMEELECKLMEQLGFPNPYEG